MDREYSPIVNTARDYYNSPDADGFYSSVWGGKDIHVGIYASPDEPIYDASRRTVERMAARLEELDADSHVLDIGAGYGGSARYLAATHGCRVTALNLSEVENERSRTMNGQSGLDPLIDVVDASYEDVPFPDGTFDAVWSQDAILHSGDRPRVLAEAARVLKSGGDLVLRIRRRPTTARRAYWSPSWIASTSNPWGRRTSTGRRLGAWISARSRSRTTRHTCRPTTPGYSKRRPPTKRS